MLPTSSNPNIRILSVLTLALGSITGIVRSETVEYDLTIAGETVNITGKDRPAITINGGIPGPVLEFTEGDHAVMRVHNKLDVPTSIHWHGLLVPPSMDGVPFVSFPPIEPHSTFVYRFPIRHSGTYWYHSHSGLQEQKGVYGQIVIHPKNQRSDIGRIDHDVPVLLSDWSDESTHEIMKTLRRGSEYYAIQKGSAISLSGAIRHGMLKDYFQRELVRMPEMDIADVYYDRFLANGRSEIFVPANPGDVVRLRLVDGSATSFFYGEFARGPMTIIEADGQPVVPVKHDRLLIGTAETYDVLVTVPRGGGAWEFRATAHDSSGHASIWIGDPHGERHAAPTVPVPNLYYSMGKPTLDKIFAFTPAGTMGMPDRKVEIGMFDTPGMTMNMEGMNGMGGMKMKNTMNTGLAGQPPHEEKPRVGMGMSLPQETGSSGGMPAMNHSGMKMEDSTASANGDGMDHSAHSAMGHGNSASGGSHGGMEMAMGPMMGGPIKRTLFDRNGREMVVDGMNPKRPLPPYPKLRALHSTAPDPGRPVREIRLTLDGDMDRYVWYLNNKALHEDDQIQIKEGEVVRFIMINRTMMYHPMHLHGHFFRLINGQGDRSPLKHTATVMPMATTVFEFEANEVGDWFFHCHLLYHMKAGMARVVEYENFTPDPDTEAVRDELFDVDLYSYGMADIMSHMTEGFYEIAGIRYSGLVNWTVGWGNIDGEDYEIDATFNYHHNRFLTLFAGAQFSNEGDYPGARGIFGYRYPLPFLISTYGWVDTEGEFRFGAAKSYPITDRLHVFGEVEYDTQLQYEWAAGLEYIIGKNISAVGSFHSEFGVGGGLSVRF
ncbi:MAG: hypothetical protein CMO55_17705 [Verrucomicrobiales bacterium]|nr:hypothetical protein [Verrucomicrobiales bacterium]